MKNKTLKLIIQPRVIDHLGIKMYQKAVDVIAEFIANAWDADAENVTITTSSNSITIEDDGCGMTFDECQNYYLTVGRDRRQDRQKDTSEKKNRPVLGRKGIGKFAGFGVAKNIELCTISEVTGEKTQFKMDIDAILNCDRRNEAEKDIEVLEYSDIKSVEDRHGTKIELTGFNVEIPDAEVLRIELSRRFLLSYGQGDFSVTINGRPLEDQFDQELEFVFPRDFTAEDNGKIPEVGKDLWGWAEETIEGHYVRWRIGFFEEPIKVEELRGISIFAKGKMAQKPFFFDLTGAISGQNALEYMTGQVEMNFIDQGENDLIATERQRINLQSALGKKIQEWGIERIKFLSSLWKSRRSKKRLDELEDRISGFSNRLSRLSKTEQKTVKSVLVKIASFPKLGANRYKEWCDDILTSWEKGRLKNFIENIANEEELDEARLLEIFSESQVLTSLNIAESIKTKVATIGELKRLVDACELENSVRDYIYEHPWIVHPRWESYKKEISVRNLVKTIADRELKKTDDLFNGRVDLVLSSGADLLILEFMRPGLKLDRDHLDRINYYVLGVRRELKHQTAASFKSVNSAYVIADTLGTSDDVRNRIEQLEKENVFILSWDMLVSEALKQWGEYLDLLKERFPKDERIQAL